MLHAAFRAFTSRQFPRRAARLQRALSYLAGLALAGISVNAAAEWRALPSSLAFETPYGTLSVQTREYIYESKLYLDNVLIQPLIQGRLDITYAYQIDDAHAALISISDGNTQCPVQYVWVTLHNKGYRVSPTFGSCSKQIKVNAKGALLILTTPNAQQAGKVDVYTYDGNRISKRVRTATRSETGAAQPK